MKSLLYDLGFALRLLRKTPGLALLAILTLALGVGANTAIFTIIDSVLLRPLPYLHSDRLVFIGAKGDKPSFGSTAWLDWHDIREQSKLFEDAAGYSEDVSVLEDRDSSISVVAPRVTPNLFSLLGRQAMLGRTFTVAEGLTGGPAVVLLSEGLWRQAFHSDRGIVGQAVKLGGKPYTVVGVMPAGFNFPEQVGPDLAKGVWLPLQPTPEMLKSRGYHFFNVVGMLRSGVTVAQAQKELDAIAAHIPIGAHNDKTDFGAYPYQEALTGPVRPVLFALFGALALVLLIACANVSNLLIARCLGRQQEFAVRAALGAGRIRLIRQMLSEGLLLSLLGCGVGVPLAQLAMLAVRKLPEGTMPRGNSIAIHWSIVLVLAAIAIVTTVLSSLLPALLVARSNPQTHSPGRVARGRFAFDGRKAERVAGGGRSRIVDAAAGGDGPAVPHTVESGAVASRIRDRPRDHVHGHARRRGRLFADGGLRGLAKTHRSSVAALTYQPLLERMRQVPGVESAALATAPPLSGMDIGSELRHVGQPATGFAEKPQAAV